MKTKLIHLVLIATGCLINIFVCRYNSYAQKDGIELTFTAINVSDHVQLDSIKVMNRTQGGDTVLYWPDTVLSLYYVGINEINKSEDSFQVFQNYPNPVTDQTTLSLYVPEKNKVSMTITDNLGQVMIKSEKVLDRGTHSFSFLPGNSGLYFFTALWEGQSSSIKILQTTSNSKRASSLRYTGNVHSIFQVKKTDDIQNFSFNPGDTLLYIGYSNTIQSGMLDIPENSKTYIFQFATNIPCPGTPTITYEGQVYNTIQIFSQCWLKENLNTGTMIPDTQTMNDNDIIEKYCYNDEPDSCAKYGGYYQWNEMMQYTMQQGTQGICPSGWHLPDDEEWKILEGAVDSQYEIGDPEWDTWGACGLDASANLKSTSGWEGNGNGLDLFGFSAIPAGDISTQSHNIGQEAYFWTSTQTYNEDAWNRVFINDQYFIWRDKYYDFYGYSVRCIRD